MTVEKKKLRNYDASVTGVTVEKDGGIGVEAEVRRAEGTEEKGVLNLNLLKDQFYQPLW
jgi:hypothetical protein